MSEYTKVQINRVCMKILFFIDTLSAGGKERRLTELMKGLRLIPEVEFELVLMNKDIHYAEIFDLDINIHFILRNTKKDPFILIKLYKLCKKYKPDIIHCWDSMTAVYSVPVCKLLGIRLVNGMVTDSPPGQNIRNRQWLRARLTFPFSDCIAGNSKAGLKAYRAPVKKSVCIYNGINSSRFINLRAKDLVRKEIFGDDSGSFRVLGMVATFRKNKDYKTLVKAALTLINERENIRFVLVGDGPELENIRSMVQPPALLNKIIFLGKRTDVESIINIFDIGILLTDSSVHGEGISNSILEYMALGKPVIASRGGGTDELVSENQNGFLIDSGNVSQLTDRILILIENNDLAEKLGNNGKKMVSEKFDIGIMKDQYITLYNTLKKVN